MAIYLLAGYILTLLIRPMDWWPPLFNVELVTIGAILILLVGFPQITARLSIIWNRIPEFKSVIFFLVGVALSPLSRFWAQGFVDVINEFGKVIIFYVLIILLVRTVKNLNVLIIAFLICAVWLAAHAAMQHHLGYGFGHQEPLSRKTNTKGEVVLQAVAFGTLNDPNDLCVILVVAIPLFYSQFKTARNPVLKLFGLAGGAFSAYGAFCTNSRGGIIAIMGMITAYVFLLIKGGKRYLVMIFTFAAVNILAPSRFAGGAFEGKDRAILWGDGLDMFKGNPIFGVGYSNFVELSNSHHVAHNSFVHVLAENGLVGYLPFFALLYLTVIHLRRLVELKKFIQPDHFILLTGINSALVGYLTGIYFISRQYQHSLYLILGLTMAGVSVISDQNGLTGQVFGAKQRDFRNGLLLGLGSVVFLWITVRLANLVS